MRLSDHDLKGRTVISADGQAIGEIAALFLDSEAWNVEAIQVALRKETADRIGVPRSFLRGGTIEIPVGLIQSVGDAVVLSSPVDRLRQILMTSPPTADAHQ